MIENIVKFFDAYKCDIKVKQAGSGSSYLTIKRNGKRIEIRVGNHPPKHPKKHQICVRPNDKYAVEKILSYKRAQELLE